MKILIDEMNPSAIRLKGDKTNFKENPNRLYFAVCLIEDDHFDELGKNFTNTIETKLLVSNNNPQPSDYFNKLNYIPDYKEGRDAHDNPNFKCHCEKNTRKNK